MNHILLLRTTLLSTCLVSYYIDESSCIRTLIPDTSQIWCAVHDNIPQHIVNTEVTRRSPDSHLWKEALGGVSQFNAWEPLQHLAFVLRIWTGTGVLIQWLD